MSNIVEMRNISIDYKLKKYALHAVSDVSLDIQRGRITALVGESGSGKTTLASAILRCISQPGELVGGTIKYYDNDDEIDVNALKGRELNKFRWERVSMVFQASQSALNPVMTVFEQFYETAKVHDPSVSRKQVKEQLKKLFDFVNLDGERVMNNYPHELSGGMKQRIMIAFAIMLNPGLIILDEPTTALDVITQDYIFKILKRINREQNIAMLLMTHDIGVVAKYADYVGVMYAGRIVEYGSVEDVFYRSAHPYTRGLIQATPSLVADLSTMKPIAGLPHDIRNLPIGCPFADRCEFCIDRCRAEFPQKQGDGEHIYFCGRACEWTK